MDDTALTVVRTFSNIFQAQLAKSALEAAGITAAIQADDCGGMRPHMQMAGVDLLVRADDADEAGAILDAAQDLSPPDNE